MVNSTPLAERLENTVENQRRAVFLHLGDFIAEPTDTVLHRLSNAAVRYQDARSALAKHYAAPEPRWARDMRDAHRN